MGFDPHGLKIAVVGLGLIGGSYAKGLSRLGVKKVTGVDLDPETREKAIASGAVQRAFETPKGAIEDADIVVVALYPALTADFIVRYAPSLKLGCVVTDAAGIKTHLLSEVARSLPPGVDFVGGHPMAGGESLGFDHSSADIFKGSSYLITPAPGAKPASIELVKAMAAALGSRIVREVEPGLHDRIIARTSHSTQVSSPL